MKNKILLEYQNNSNVSAITFRKGKDNHYVINIYTPKIMDDDVLLNLINSEIKILKQFPDKLIGIFYMPYYPYQNPPFTLQPEEELIYQQS